MQCCPWSLPYGIAYCPRTEGAVIKLLGMSLHPSGEERLYSDDGMTLA